MKVKKIQGAFALVWLLHKMYCHLKLHVKLEAWLSKVLNGYGQEFAISPLGNEKLLQDLVRGKYYQEMYDPITQVRFQVREIM